MSSEFQANGELRGSADPAGAPNAAGPQGKPFSGVPPSKRSRSRRRIILVGAAAAALLGGAGAVAAAGGGVTAANATVASVSQPPPSGSQHVGGMHGFFSALHGQFVVPKPGGGYQTVDLQRGTVSAVSATSITVKSADGFTQSYAVTATTIVGAQRDGIGSVRTGDQASVFATVSGRTATAAGIIDKTLLQQSHKQFG